VTASAAPPRISVVINTLNRASSLRSTLESFRWQTYEGEFEIIVVNGPSTDDTQAVAESWLPHVRIGRCSEPNLSMSRNIGICMAAGEIVAFIDDDGIPEPEWLEQIAAAFDSPEVGGAGGRVYDHTGYEFQCEYCLVDRLGNADIHVRGPTPQRAFPGSFQFPHLLGTNAAYRREILLSIKGFDEEFEYYLDETDVCLRLIDAGYLIRQLERAYVHHKFAASNMRTERRVLRHRYAVMKNKIYFTLKHGGDFLSQERILEDQERFLGFHRDEVRWCVDNGYLSEEDAVKFEGDAEKAVAVGRARGAEGAKAMIDQTKLANLAGAFVPFPRLEPIGRRWSIVLVTQDYPPGHGGGIATFNRDLAAALAAIGHLVDVVCQSPDIDRVDFEAGVWVHRIVKRSHPLRQAAQDRGIPQHIWDWSATALAEVRRIATHRPIDVVEAPIWDCQGAAFMLEGRWPLVTSLQTSLRFFLDGHPELAGDRRWMAEFGTPMLALEREVMERSNAIRAISQAIGRDIEAAYDFKFARDQVIVAPLGLADNADARLRRWGDPEGEGTDILFVGRLEHRKGIDILLQAIPLVLAEAPDARFRIVGDDSLPGPGGRTYRALFEASESGKIHGHRVEFSGKLDDESLNRAYADCGIFVAPSRYESFGLVFLEAKRQAKPVIGCAVGGMLEIIREGETGYLVPPDDAAALAAAILRLVRDPELRRLMGRRGRERFKQCFTDRRMAENSLPLYRLARSRPPYRHKMKLAFVNGICVRHDAISNAIRAEIEALGRRFYHDVKLFTLRCDDPALPAVIVASADEIAADPHFQESDLAIFHFGIYSPLFELLPQIGARTKRLVIFHNVTPKHVMANEAHELIDRSLAQMALISTADRVLCDSATNLSVLRAAGIETPATVLPLAVPIIGAAPETKPSFTDGVLRIVFLGRFVRSKGPQDLLAALGGLSGKVRVDLMGNQHFSDPTLIAELEAAARRLPDGVTVTFNFGIGEEGKRRILSDADIFALPTYHEGFCVPIVEAMGRACRVVTYDNSNTPAICNGLGRLIATGDVAGFAQALGEIQAECLSEAWRQGGYQAYRSETANYVRGFDPEVIGERFVDILEECVSVAPA
jgi:glycosyltransferase involved in cell wall biosynthesis